MLRLQGIGVSPGIAIGEAYRYAPTQVSVTQDHVSDPDSERQRLLVALGTADKQLQTLYEETRQRVGSEQAAIFEAQRAFLHDPELRQNIEQKIMQEHLNAGAALSEAFGTFMQLLVQTDNPYLRERAADLRDVRDRVLRALQPATTSPHIDRPVIIVADDLTPSDTMQLDPHYVLALCTASGGPTSHAAILARALGIPAVVAVGDNLLGVVHLALDGASGEVVLAPDTETRADFEQRKRQWENQQIAIRVDVNAPTVTRDGHHVEIAANVGRLPDVDVALQNGAEGIGLLRTEFLYMERLPDEDSQAAIYRQIAERMYPHTVIIRALDIGGDKPLPYLPMPYEANPFLGFRAIRLLLANRDLFASQVRAVVRANTGLNNIKLMLPMVSDTSELRAARQLLDEVRVGQEISLGMMVETPAAALMADQFADYVDFFSIGTNDLTMYTLAVDRGSPQVSYLYDALHPAVLRLIKRVVDIGLWVGVCGELAGQPEATAILVGLGVNELSMSPGAIPAIKHAIRNLDYHDARALAAQALAQPDAASVHRLVTPT
jgi:phosphoenolpyruvate-protein phosphotransferase